MTKTQTDAEIRTEFEEAAKRQPAYRQIQTKEATTERLDYSSAGATRRR